MVVDPEKDFSVLKGLSSPTRVRILKLLHDNGPTNVNVIAEQLGEPQSSISTNVRVLEESGLIETELTKARKGTQKICRTCFDELIIAFRDRTDVTLDNTIEVAMPIGLYSECKVTAPCGIFSPDGGIGLLDEPTAFLEPERMTAALLWFTSGYVEYQFPRKTKVVGSELEALELSLECSSEVPGTHPDCLSEITVSVNGVMLGQWTPPGFGETRGRFTPQWWKLKGSQYGMLKTWSVTHQGSFVDGVRISDVSLADLDLKSHHSIRTRIEVLADAECPGGLNIFGRGFGNYDQDIVLRMRMPVKSRL